MRVRLICSGFGFRVWERMRVHALSSVSASRHRYKSKKNSNACVSNTCCHVSGALEAGACCCPEPPPRSLRAGAEDPRRLRCASCSAATSCNAVVDEHGCAGNVWECWAWGHVGEDSEFDVSVLASNIPCRACMPRPDPAPGVIQHKSRTTDHAHRSARMRATYGKVPRCWRIAWPRADEDASPGAITKAHSAMTSQPATPAPALAHRNMSGYFAPVHQARPAPIVATCKTCTRAHGRGRLGTRTREKKNFSRNFSRSTSISKAVV